MTNTHLNIRTDKEVKEAAEQIFSDLGLNMTTAINMFLRTTIRENGIPFDLKLKQVNDETHQAIEEGQQMLADDQAQSFSTIEELKESLDI